jgi:hypothetical protein
MGETVNPHRNRDRGNGQQNKSKLFDLLEFDQNLLLPIVIMFLLGQNDSNIPILDDIKKVAKNIIDIPLNIDVSTKDIEKMIEAVNSVSPYISKDNVFVLDTFADFLSAVHKISTVKEFRSDMTRSSSGNPRKPLKFKNQKEKALHMLGALEQFMDEPTKKNMKDFKDTLGVLEKFEQTTSALNEKKKGGGPIDIKDIMQFIGPLLGGGGSVDAQKIDSMIRMVQIMSALDESDLNTDGPSDPVSFREDDDSDGGCFEFVIDRYDDEDDEE